MSVKLSAVFVLLVICQICSSAPTATNDDSLPSPSVAEFLCVSKFLPEKGVDQFEEKVLHALIHVLSLAVQENNETVDLNRVLGPHFNLEDMDGFDENELKEIENDLSKVLKPAQTERVMKFVNAFREGNYEEKLSDAMKDVILFAAPKCATFPTATNDDSSSESADADADATIYKPVESPCFLNVLKQLGKNTSEAEKTHGLFDLISLAVRENNETIDLNQVLGPRVNNFGEGGFTENGLEEIENELTKALTPAQTERVMKTLRKLQKGSEVEDVSATMDDLFLSASLRCASASNSTTEKPLSETTE